MNEVDFTKRVVMPLLRKLGFRRIRYAHGIDEFGRDLIFFDTDRFGQEIVCACQVKIGDLRGTQKKKIQNEIIPQLLEGLRTPYHDPETGAILSIHRIYLIISEHIIGSAKEQIHSLVSTDPNIFIIDKQNIEIFSGGDGFETDFWFTIPGSGVNKPAYLPYKPRLPLLSRDTWLDIPLYIDKDINTDAIHIANITYDPLLKIQRVTLSIPCDSCKDLTDALVRKAAEELLKWFENSGEALFNILNPPVFKGILFK